MSWTNGLKFVDIYGYLRSYFLKGAIWRTSELCEYHEAFFFHWIRPFHCFLFTVDIYSWIWLTFHLDSERIPDQQFSLLPFFLHLLSFFSPSNPWCSLAYFSISICISTPTLSYAVFKDVDIGNLKMNTKYRVTVGAYGWAGEGRPSMPRDISTASHGKNMWVVGIQFTADAIISTKVLLICFTQFNFFLCH